MAKRQQLLTRQQLADTLGVVPMTITRWEADGCPVAKKQSRGRPSLFDLEAVRAWRERVEAAAKERQLSLEQERALLTRAQREKTEMQNAVMRGELLPRDLVELEGQAYTKAWAAKVRGLVKRALHAGLITRDDERAFADLCDDVLREISAWTTPGMPKRGGHAA